MHKIVHFQVLFIIILNLIGLNNSFAGPIHEHSLYGKDSRQEVSSIKNSSILEWVPRTVVLVEKEYLKTEGKKIKAQCKSLKDTFNLCDNEKFAEQPSLGFCTGFWVDANWIATASHCVEKVKCADINIIHNFVEDKNNAYFIRSKNILSCSEILISTDHDVAFIHIPNNSDENDNLKNKHKYNLVRQNNNSSKNNKNFNNKIKSSTFRKNVNLNLSNIKYHDIFPQLASEDEGGIYMLGFPSGLPMKISSGFVVKKNKSHIKAYLDSFGGNSGSPVITDDGELVGMLVNGEEDYWHDPQLKCSRPFVCGEDGKCDGEELISKHHIIEEYKNLVIDR